MILDYDSYILLQFMDNNFDGRISRTELLSHFEERLFNLVLEDTLTSNFHLLKKTKKWKKSPIDKYFPFEGSTIGKQEIEDILQKFDMNGDKTVKRREMA